LLLYGSNTASLKPICADCYDAASQNPELRKRLWVKTIEGVDTMKEFRFALPNEPDVDTNGLLTAEADSKTSPIRQFYQPEIDGESPCAMCPIGRECVACARITPTYNKDYNKAALELRKWWAERVKRMKQPENKFMRAGKEAHERLDVEHGVVHDLDKVFEALRNVGGTIRWSARLCSRLDGIRGQPDMVESTRVAPDKIYHKIIEWKSHPSRHRKYFPQAVAYALIMSYPRVIADGLYFYDHISPTQSFSVDIDFEFRYYETGYTRSYQFVRDNKFIATGEDGFWPDGRPYGAEYVFGVKRLIKKFSGLTRVKQIRDISRCGFCEPLDNPKSVINGGDARGEDLCHVWPLCRDDLLLSKRTTQGKLGRWVRRKPARAKLPPPPEPSQP